jgi:hypothetical protein
MKMQETTTQPPLDKRRREAHPECIDIGGKKLERNDIVAKRHGTSVRSTNRRDGEGAPYLFIGNVKYRPQPDYDDFILSGIVRRPRLGRTHAHISKRGAARQINPKRFP